MPPASRTPARIASSTSAWARPLIVSRTPSANAGPSATTTSVGSVPAAAAAASSSTGARPAAAPPSVRGSTTCGKRLQQLPALALEPVARPRPEVRVRVVHRGAHEPVRLDDRRRLEVVRRDALAEHPDDRLGDVLEAAAVERERDVERRDAAREQLVGRLDVCGPVAIGHVAARVPDGRGLDLRLGDVRQAELGERRLHGPRRPFPYAQQLVLGDRLDAAVDLPVALDREPFVDVVGVVVAARRTCCRTAASRSSRT